MPLEAFLWHRSIEDESQLQLEQLQFVASLTTLTELELYNLPYQRDAKVLWSLSQLRSLSVLDCYYMELDLIAPGAFPALTSLHIEELLNLGERHAHETEERSPLHPYYDGVERQKLLRVQQALSGMINLKVLTGVAQMLVSCDLAGGSVLQD